jgi:hypothetical protein
VRVKALSTPKARRSASPALSANEAELSAQTASQAIRLPSARHLRRALAERGPNSASAPKTSSRTFVSTAVITPRRARPEAPDRCLGEAEETVGSGDQSTTLRESKPMGCTAKLVSSYATAAVRGELRKLAEKARHRALTIFPLRSGPRCSRRRAWTWGGRPCWPRRFRTAHWLARVGPEARASPRGPPSY